MNTTAGVRHRPASGVVGMFLAIAFLASACSSGSSRPAGEPTDAAAPSARVTSLRDLSELRERFNEGAGEVRLVLLLSPT